MLESVLGQSTDLQARKVGTRKLTSHYNSHWTPLIWKELRQRKGSQLTVSSAKSNQSHGRNHSSCAIGRAWEGVVSAFDDHGEAGS